MPKSIYTIRCIERIYTYYRIEADNKEDAINSAHMEGEFIDYGDFIETEEGSGEIVDTWTLP